MSRRIEPPYPRPKMYDALCYRWGCEEQQIPGELLCAEHMLKYIAECGRRPVTRLDWKRVSVLIRCGFRNWIRPK